MVVSVSSLWRAAPECDCAEGLICDGEILLNPEQTEELQTA